MAKKTLYKRILLKVSGQALLGKESFGIEPQAVMALAEQICEVRKHDVEVGVVVGGGNIIRGSQAKGLRLSRERADQMGMLATTINGVMLAEALEKLGCNAVVVGAFQCGTFIPEGSGDETVELLQNGVVVIFVGGTGHPYFTTDTAAALRACEIKADCLIKGTKVDGIFDKDPVKNPKARRFDRVTYNEVLCGKLNVMDAAAVAICRDSNMPIRVLNIFKKGALKLALESPSVGSFVTGE